jgi:oligopeptide transport system substrate-binding protein
MLKKLFYFVVCSSLLLFYSCTNSSKDLVRLSLNIVNEPHSLDTKRLRSLSDINIANMLFEGLFRTTNEGLKQALAEKYWIDESQTKIKIQLKKAFWSDGSLITAHDFVKTYETILDPDFPADYAFLFYYIKGAEKIKKEHADLCSLGVKALDEMHLEFELNHPTPFFLELLSLPVFFPSSGKEGVYNGPFCLYNWFHNYQITLRKNDHYWDKQQVKIDQVELHMCDSETGLQLFEKGLLDLEGSPFGVIPPDSKAALAQQNRLFTQPIWGTQWIRVNTSRDELSDKYFRQAMAAAIDRKDLCEHILYNPQAQSLRICPHSLCATALKDGAKDHVHQLLQTSHQTRILTLSYANSALNHRLAQAIQSQLDSCGIQIQLERLEPKVFFSRVSKKDYDLALGNWIADVPDPINFLQNFRTQDTGTNNTCWENTSFKELLDQSQFLKGNERVYALEKAEQILLDEVPVIPLYQMSMQYVKNPQLRGVYINKLGLIDIKEAYFADED